jgi:antitoxin (DNA-binding transcriptional repressor) of toxin-antitoxin stability system
MLTITATDLARNTRKILDAVASRSETVLVERNNMTIARITPPEPHMTASQTLAGFQRLVTPEQATSWLQDSRTGFDDTVQDPWAR